MAPDPLVSVIIPSVPESSHRSVVDMLSEQDFEESYEVLVVNDSSLGVSDARNAGLLAANADTVAFIDDDCEPESNWLSSIYSEMKDNEFVCIEGKVVGGLSYTGKRGYPTCNLTVDRETAIDVGGFRSEFDGWREDTEFGWRMERDGDGKCGYNPNQVVAHPSRPRANYIDKNEQLLKNEYPDNYNEVMNNTIKDRLFRALQKRGITNWLNHHRWGEKSQ